MINPTASETLPINVYLDQCASITTHDYNYAKDWELKGHNISMEVKGVGGVVHHAVAKVATVTLGTYNGKAKLTFPACFTPAPAGNVRFDNWENYKSLFPEDKDVDLPAPALVIPERPEIGGIIGTDLNILMTMDLDSEGAPEIGGQGFLKPLTQPLICGWTISGFTNPRPLYNVHVLQRKEVC